MLAGQYPIHGSLRAPSQADKHVHTWCQQSSFNFGELALGNAQGGREVILALRTTQLADALPDRS